MSAEGKGTGAITGITNFLFLAFVLPGVIFLCFILLLFSLAPFKKLFPELVLGLDVAIGAIIFLGLIITSITFAVEICWDGLRSLVVRKQPAFKAYSEIIFNADRQKELGWYFWQLWGQSIMHWNIAWGVFLIYFIYKYTYNEIWPMALWFSSWKDFAMVVIIANFVCWFMFRRWHDALMARLTAKE